MRRWWVEREKMGLIKENVWSGNQKKKKKLWDDDDVTQPKSVTTINYD